MIGTKGLTASPNVVNEAFTISTCAHFWVKRASAEDNLELDQRLDHEFVRYDSGRESTDPVDFAFLETQTFSDAALARELLDLFVAQVRRIVPTLPALSPQAQADTAHLLKGSARGIGAWAAAETAAAYEAAPANDRHRDYPALAAAFAATEAAISEYLAGGTG